MNNLKDIRWHQRFENFERSYMLLKKSLQLETVSDVERAGIIQFFEMTFELSWKLIKDYLDSEGILVKSPREAIKHALQIELINGGDVWLMALSDRNLTVHTYDEAKALAVENMIRNTYFLKLEELYNVFKGK
jgi:nucleotidyltransferase substrate binding protein (TIGR01987 family)